MSTNLNAVPVRRARPGTREVLLAGIGAVSLARRNAGAAVKEAIAIAGRVPAATSIMIEGLGETGNDYRNAIIARAGTWRGRIARTVGSLAADAQARLQPLLGRFDGVAARFGIARTKPAPRRGRKAAKAKPAATRRKVRKAA